MVVMIEFTGLDFSTVDTLLLVGLGASLAWKFEVDSESRLSKFPALLPVVLTLSRHLSLDSSPRNFLLPVEHLGHRA